MSQAMLFEGTDEDLSTTSWLGQGCWIQSEGDLRIVAIGGTPVFRVAHGDVVAERLAAATIVESKAARVAVTLKAFDLDDATLWRARQALREGGVEALVPKKRGPKGPRGPGAATRRRIQELRTGGWSERSIADRVHVPRSTVRRVLEQCGIGKRAAAVQGNVLDSHLQDGDLTGSVAAEVAIGAGSDPSVPPAAAEETAGVDNTEPDPSRKLDPVATVSELGAIMDDSEMQVEFNTRSGVPNAGVLLALPALVSTGLFDSCRSVYGSLRTAIYGLRSVVLVLSALALLRRPRPEALKGTDPMALGHVLGLGRAPEVKTLRRKLSEIAQRGKAFELMRHLARSWIAEVKDVLGIVYVDGHVRVYHGKHKLPKAHVTLRNLALRANTDYWLNDADGQPLLLVPAKANEALTEMLPGMIEEVEALSDGQRGTVVFDRGGWSPDLFASLIKRGWHILTYRKGKKDWHPPEAFTQRRVRIDGHLVTLTISERTVRLRNGLELREIAELRDDGGQTILLTSHLGHPAELLAYRLFQRWRQENFFRYMKENFALDALVEHGVDPGDPDREIPNPRRKAHRAAIAKARAHMASLEQKFGAAAADNVESERPTMRGFKIANGKTGQELRAAREQLAQLERELKTLPARVRVGEVLDRSHVVRLPAEKKLFTDVIKAAVYRAETALLELLARHFKRSAEEGRAFLRAAVQQPGNLIVDGDVLTVEINSLSAPRYTAALAALCDELNALAPQVPESAYRLRFQVAQDHSPET